MAISVKRLVRTHGALVAAFTALWVTVAIIALRLAETVVGWLAALPYIPAGQGYPVGAALGEIATIALPFGIGYFLGLWLVAPIAEELRIGHVVTRAVLATGIGATLVFVVLAILAVLAAFSGNGALFGNSFPFPSFDGGYAVSGLGIALTSAALSLIWLLPVGVLGGVLLWIWRKDHPPRHPLSGLIDEV